MKELEIEFKNMLTGNEFGRLREAFFQNAKPVVQTNFYIDTPELEMRANRLLLRIREARGSQVMTLKKPSEDGVMEYHGEVASDLNFDRNVPASEVPGLIREELERFSIDTAQLKIYGALSTERFEVPYKEGRLVLDSSTFLDETDYELEYEVDDYAQGETHFLELLEDFSIDRRREITKSERFYTKLSSIRTGDNYAFTL